MIAGHFGKSPAWAIWEIPLSIFLQYRHCALRASDEWTVKPQIVKLASLEKLEGYFDVTAEEEE